MKESSGTLLYRTSERGLEVLLVHASGNYNRRSPWGIPKGWPEAGESLEETARRETWEETGVAVAELTSIGFIDYTKSRKRVHAFVAEAAMDVMPQCASWEIDAAEFLPIDVARQRIHPDQAAFLDRLERLLSKS